MPTPKGRPKRRQIAQRAHRGEIFKRALFQLNRIAEQAFPVETYRDVRGRQRRRGHGARKRAFDVLQALIALQGKRKDRTVFAGYEKLGKAMGGRSRSTAYRGVKDVIATELIEYDQGGGKIYNEQGQLVPMANGYRLHPQLVGPPQRQRQSKHPQKTGGEMLSEEARRRWVRRRGPPSTVPEGAR